MPETEINLKKKYNEYLTMLGKIEDFSYRICKTPIYKDINDNLRSLAVNIARLNGFTGDGVQVYDHFKKYELIKGFAI